MVPDTFSPRLKRYSFTRNVPEERSFLSRLELFRSKRQRLHREGQLEILGDIEYALHAIPPRTLKVGNNQEVDIAQGVHVSPRHASEKKNTLRMKFLADLPD